MTKVAEGEVLDIDDDEIFFRCGCGEDLLLTPGETRECYGCKKKIVGTIKIEVYEIEKGQDETNTRTG